MDPLNIDTLLHADALPKNVIFLPACSLIPSRTPNAVEILGPHVDGILTVKFASHRDLNIMLDIFNKSTAYFSSTQQAYQEVKYVAAGGKAADIRTQEVEDFSKDIHGVGLSLGLSRNGKSITVRGIAPGSPAALCESVISVHDHLLKVDDVDVKHSCSTLEDVANLIRGIRGTTVKLQLRRSRDVEEARHQDVEQSQAAHSPTLTQAKSKYEVTLRRQPAVDLNAIGVTSGAESLEADGSERKELANDDLKAVGQTTASMRNSDSRETPENEWLQEQQESPDTDLCPKQSISNAGSFNRLNSKVLKLSRQPGSNLENNTQPQQSIDHLRLSNQTEHREAVPSRSGGSVLTESVGSGRVLMDSIRSVGLTDEHSKIRNPYSSILARAGEKQARARLTRSDMFESSAALPGRSTGLEVREKPENTYSNIIQRVGERQARSSVLESSAALPGRPKGLDVREKPKKALGSFYLSDIGITFHAVDGRHIVHGVLPNAPLSVHHNVCLLDELLSVDGEDVTHTSPDGVAALLKAKRRQHSFCFVEILFCDSNADSNIQLTFNRNSTIVRFV
jgi:hypothetical protein